MKIRPRGRTRVRRPQPLRGEVVETEVLRFDAGEISPRGLSSAGGGELDDKLAFRGFLQTSKLVSIGMGQMLKIEWAGDAILQIRCWKCCQYVIIE
jgi:hypothetical protein